MRRVRYIRHVTSFVPLVASDGVAKKSNCHIFIIVESL